MRRTATVAIAAMGLVVALAVPAGAAGPVITHIDEQGVDEEFSGFLTEACGFEVTVAFDEHTTLREYANGSIRATVNLHFTYTSPYTTLFEDDHFMDYVDPAAGIDRVTGIPFLIRRADRTVIFRDRGTVAFNLDTGEIVFEHGPHPGLHDTSVFGICGDLNPEGV